MNSEYEQAVIRKLVAFGEATETVRAVVLTSSLCNPKASADILSDFDVEFFFDDPAIFAASDEWLEGLSDHPVMALWHWPNEWDHEPGDGRRWMRMVYFQDGTKMDVSLCYLASLREICAAEALPDHYDIGYRVLLDKDGVTSAMKPPAYKAYILNPPSEAQFDSRMEAFWMNSTYAAKFLWRDDIMAARWMLQEMADRGVREVLEWAIAMRHGWTWRAGRLGRGLPKALDAEERGELFETFAAGDPEALWNSLFRTTALYRKTAIRVAEALGYSYPHGLDKRVTIFHQTLRGLNRQTGTREQLARLLGQSYRRAFPPDPE